MPERILPAPIDRSEHSEDRGGLPPSHRHPERQSTSTVAIKKEQDEESAVSTSEALSCGDTGDLPSTHGHQNMGQATTIGMETEPSDVPLTPVGGSLCSKDRSSACLHLLNQEGHWNTIGTMTEGQVELTAPRPAEGSCSGEPGCKSPLQAHVGEHGEHISMRISQEEDAAHSPLSCDGSDHGDSDGPSTSHEPVKKAQGVTTVVEQDNEHDESQKANDLMATKNKATANRKRTPSPDVMQAQGLAKEIMDEGSTDSLKSEILLLRKENKRLRKELRKRRNADDYLERAERILKAATPFQTLCIAQAEDISFDGNDAVMLDEPGTGTESSQAVSINEGLDLLDEPQPDGPHDEPLEQEPQGMPREPEELEDVKQEPPQDCSSREPSPLEHLPEEHSPQHYPPKKQPPKCQFRHKKRDKMVVELAAGSEIFLPKLSLAAVKRSKTATSMARALLTTIFTKEALLTCSMRGHGTHGLFRNQDFTRPALDQRGVDAIIEFTMKNSSPSMGADPVKLIKSLGTRLSELRAQAQKQGAMQ